MILGDLLPAAGNTTILYNANVGLGATGTLYFVNQSSTEDAVQVALTLNANSSPVSKSYIMYNTPAISKYTVVISDITLGENQGLYVYSLNGTTSFTFIGSTL